MVSIQIGSVSYSSPALAPDGSVYVATFDKNPDISANQLVRVSGGSAPAVLKRFSLGGQLSSPAVDSKGNVYVARDLGYHAFAHLVSIDSTDQTKWNLQLGQEGNAFAPPKVLDMNGGALVFQPYTGGNPVGGHVIVTNDLGSPLDDFVACPIEVGGSLLGDAGFHVQGVDLGPPYPEEPAVGIRALQEDRGKQYYMVVATSRCGIAFYRFNLGATNTVKPTFTPIQLHHSDTSYFAAPVISADGIAVIADSDKRITAYDVTTGDEKWHYDTASFVSTAPALLPLAINFVYVATYDHLIKLDLSTGQMVGEMGLIGPVDASPAAAGEHVFVSTQSGLFTYGLNLNLLAFTPLAGGRSSPAIGPAGEVWVAGTDGRLCRFPGP